MSYLPYTTFFQIPKLVKDYLQSPDKQTSEDDFGSGIFLI